MAQASSSMPDAGDDEQDRVWLSLVCQGGRAGEKATEALFRKYRGRLRSFLVHRGAHENDADEIVQDTFLRMVRSACGFRSEARVSSWLFQIARNLQIDHARKDRPELTMDDAAWLVYEGKKETVAANQASIASSIAAESLQECVDRAFAEFRRESPERAEALRLVSELQWAIREVAAFLGRTEGATREYLSQCKKKFKLFADPCRQFLREV